MPASRSTRPVRSLRTRTTRRPPVIPILFGVIVLFGVVAIVASRGDDDDDVPAGVEQTRPVSVSGEALPAHEAAGADPAVGSPIPEVEGQDFAGEPVTITRDGTPKLIVFLAHWCPHCQAEVPVITDWVGDEGAPEGVELLSVSTSVNEDRPNYPPSRWLEQEGWPVPVLADDDAQTAAQAFGLSAFPFFVAVDAQGMVTVRGSGELGVEALEQLVATARAG